MKAGDTVVLNDVGLQQIFGSPIGLKHMKNLRMKITYVDPVSLTFPEETHTVSVDNLEIDKFFINNHYFDVVNP